MEIPYRDGDNHVGKGEGSKLPGMLGLQVGGRKRGFG
jgi:hypothetical protein